MKTEVIICSCWSPEHQILINKDEEDKEVYLSIYLRQYRNFFMRLWVGIRYAFGYRSRYGDWDSIILGPEHADQLQDVVDHLRGLEIIYETLNLKTNKWSQVSREAYYKKGIDFRRNYRIAEKDEEKKAFRE